MGEKRDGSLFRKGRPFHPVVLSPSIVLEEPAREELKKAGYHVDGPNGQLRTVYGPGMTRMACMKDIRSACFRKGNEGQTDVLAMGTAVLSCDWLPEGGARIRLPSPEERELAKKELAA